METIEKQRGITTKPREEIDTQRDQLEQIKRNSRYNREIVDNHKRKHIQKKQQHQGE